MIEITPEIALADDEVVERFVRAAGPGGQMGQSASCALPASMTQRMCTTIPGTTKQR